MSQYLHTDIEISQTPKSPSHPCGDFATYFRDKYATSIILCDGKGSGIKANLAARMTTARIEKMLKSGISVEKTAFSVADTMQKAIDDDLPYSVFSILRILNDGNARILSYNMPEPIFLNQHNAEILEPGVLNISGTIINEYLYKLDIRESIILMSDGVPESGLGNGLPKGWTIEGVKRHVNKLIKKKMSPSEIALELNAKAISLSSDKFSDDVTVISAQIRRGSIANIFTGPPEDKHKDKTFTNRFLSLQGQKIICGGTSANIIADNSGFDLVVENNAVNDLTPPTFSMSGIDLVTEGAMTLNQLYNVLDEDYFNLEPDNPVTELHELLSVSDRINFFVGNSINEANDDIRFRQMGLSPRHKIIPLLAQKLQDKDKLIVVEYI